LREGGVCQSDLESLANGLDGWDRVPNMEQLCTVLRHLAVLHVERFALLHQLPLPTLKLR